MFLPLFLLFTAVPVIELMLLFKAGAKIGGLTTIIIVIITGILGAHFARSQGRQILIEIQRKTQSGQMPANDLIHGLLVFGGGLLLVTPGFITDALGLMMVFPLTRFIFVQSLKKHFAKKVQMGAVNFSQGPGFGSVHVHTVRWDSESQSRHVETIRDVTPKKVKDLNAPDKGPESTN